MLYPMRPRTRAVWLGIGALLIVAGTAWLWRTPGAAPTQADLRGANLLLVTVDTLRADRLGAYGNTAGLTPTLDALAQRGIRFDHARSHAPITLTAHASILTGLLPPDHGVRNNGSFRLEEGPATLAEQLRAAGYRTGAFVGAFVLDARFGLNRGFDEYDDRYDTAAEAASFTFVERTADHVLGAATAWITRPATGDSRPWFAWVHLFDPHAPYRAPASSASGRTPYDGEVAWTDSALGTALRALSNGGQMDRTLVIVTADHGESLGDHGETTHGLFAYDATMRVPLIVAGPTLEPRVVSTPVGHSDILPTALDLLGINPPAVDGQSRRADIQGSSSEPSPIYFESLDANLTRGWAPLTGVVSEHWKYIDLPEPELYDLDTDPGEQSNIIAREPRRVETLQARLRTYTAAPATPGPPVDSTQAARLQSLGYISGSARQRAVFTLADDPKRLVGLSEAFNTALEKYGSGAVDGAITSFSQILAARPDFLAARLSAATALIAGGKAAAALSLLRDADAADKAQPLWLTRQGQALAATGALPAAREVLSAAVTATHGDPEPLNELGVVLVQLGDTDGARRVFRRLLDADPSAVRTAYNLGLLELGARRPAAAAVAFRAVVGITPQHADAWRGLGASLAPSDAGGAADAWRHVLAIEPGDFDTLYNLGTLLNDAGQGEAAIPHLRRFAADAPRDRYAADLARVRALLVRLERRR